MSFSKELKVEVAKKSHFTCCLCRRSIGFIEIHHIIPQNENGPDTFENAAPLCPTCHETFGDNPQKRTMIREARDQWFDICKQRYQGNDRLVEAFEQIMVKEDFLGKVAEKIAVKVTENLTPIKNPGFQKMSLSECIGRVLNFKNDFPAIDMRDVEPIYNFLFNTKGREKSKVDEEYNEIKDVFLKYFGELVARNICIYLFNEYKIDWKKGMIETQFGEIIKHNFIIMTILLHQEEIAPPGLELEVQVTKEAFTAIKKKN